METLRKLVLSPTTMHTVQQAQHRNAAAVAVVRSCITGPDSLRSNTGSCTGMHGARVTRSAATNISRAGLSFDPHHAATMMEERHTVDRRVSWRAVSMHDGIQRSQQQQPQLAAHWLHAHGGEEGGRELLCCLQSDNLTQSARTSTTRDSG